MRPLGAADPTVVGPYRLLGVLGDGGMSRVYLGQSPGGRRLAVKVVRAYLAEDPAFRRRFAREVAAAKAVSPLFTAALVDADTEAESPWLATTYIEGPSLDQLVNEQGPLAPDAVLTLAAGLAEALASIHRSGLVHRDLKPSNVIINDAGPHIIDFGVALLSNDTPVTTSVVLGTPSYMAPERINGEEAGPAADIFSLGATLVRAATGKSLVARGSMYEQVIQIAQGRFDLSGLPTELRPLVMRCISRNPRDRPTADELVHILVGSGARAPEPDWYQATVPAVEAGNAGRGLSRRRVLAASGVLGTAAVAGSVVAAAGWSVGRRGAALWTTAASPAPGTVLWQASSGARQPGATVPLIADRGQRIITADGSNLLAADAKGARLWSRTLPSAITDLRWWTDAVLVTTGERLWLLDPSNGSDRFTVDVAVHSLALSADRAFLDTGTATAALDRHGRVVWTVPRPAGGTPFVADGRWLVTRDAVGPTVTVGLYEAGTGRHQWSTQYEWDPAAPVPADGPPPGAGAAPPGSGPRPGSGPPPGGGPPGPPPDDAAWHRSEGRLTGAHVVLRDAQQLTVLRLAGGGTAWRRSLPRPVVAIEPVRDLVLVAADRLSAFVAATGALAWQVPLRGARLAATGRDVVAVTDLRIVGLDAAGGTRWQVPLPDAVGDALPDQLTTDGPVAIVTFRPRPARAQPPDADVVAVALDAPG